MESLIVSLAVVFVAIIILLKTAIVVPQQNGYVVERLGKYSKTLNAGFHILIPFFERVAYKHSLKEQAADIAERVGDPLFVTYFFSEDERTFMGRERLGVIAL